MKILTAEQIRKCDQFTIDKEPVSSILLMERAALACSDWISENCKNHKKFAVFCGNGNNGGDGLAIARMLYLKGFDVDVFINQQRKFSEDASVNFKRLKDFSGIDIKKYQDINEYNFDSKTIIIDALFGTGLSRELGEEYQELINRLNDKKSIRISIDISSGLFADTIIEKDSSVFKADYTLSFQFWKKSFLHPETGKYTGKVIILDIDLNKEFIEDIQTKDFIIDDYLIDDIFNPRQEFSHKGTYGKAVIVGGSYGKIGAAVLSTKSALKVGTGLTFALAPKCGYEVLQSTCPEAMFIEGGTDYIQKIEMEKDVILGIGPGLGTNSETEKALLEFLKYHPKPIVLDADALNIISKDENNVSFIPKGSIITPHPKEFERLFRSSENSYERLEKAKKKAIELQIYIVLKDRHTQVITPEGKVYYNITGNSGLAKGGSGDILTGILTSFLAQGYSEEEAAVLGVWFHGKAADLAARKYSKEAMLPTDVISEFGNVFHELNRRNKIKL